MLQSLLESTLSGLIGTYIFKDEYIDLLLESIQKQGLLTQEELIKVREEIIVNLEPHRKMGGITTKAVLELITNVIQKTIKDQSWT